MGVDTTPGPSAAPGLGGDAEPGAQASAITLRAGAAHALAILDAALDAVVTIDHLGRVLEFNLAAERIFGYRRDAVLGQELAELIVPPAHRAAHRQALARWTATGPGEGAGGLLGRRIDVTALRADGTEFPAELAISRVDVPGPPLFTACIRDVSDRRDAEERLRGAELRYRTLVEQVPFVTYVDVSADLATKPLYLSPKVEHLLGVTADDWLATPDTYERAIHPDDRDWVLAAKQAAYDAGESLRIEYRMRAADGRLVWFEDRSQLVTDEEGPAYRQGFALDITERKQAEDALRQAETRYRTLVEQLPLVVYIDRLDDKSSNIYTSPQVETMLGYPAEQWIADPSLFFQLLHADDRERVLAAHAASRVSGVPLRLDYRLIARDGHVVWVHDEARLIAGRDGGELVLQGYLLDVTARREAEELLRHQAFHDPLTGLANRALFADRVEHALVREDGAAGAAVLFVDLDDFKRVNDTFGHPTGDALLQSVAARLRGALAPVHTVARVGGDEFAILLEGADAAGAALTAGRLIAGLEGPFVLDGHEVYVTASVGVAVGAEAGTLMRSADVAMYRAKSSGKAQYVLYAPKMEDAVVGRLQLVADVRRARIEEEFLLHYQPTVDLATGAIVGVEALVRWRHPGQGLLQPAEFIPLTEETGRIVELGRWVLDEACRRTADWRVAIPGAADLSVNVNVSTRQVLHPGFVESVQVALERSGLAPTALTLEITESVLAPRWSELAEILENATQLGVRLALDDFGTGYSSLSLLHDLPVDTLKIDRSFVQRIEAGGQRSAFVRAIVGLAGALDLTLVAEGIERAEHVAELRRLGCRLGQGFYFSLPLGRPELEEVLRTGLSASLLDSRTAA